MPVQRLQAGQQGDGANSCFCASDDARQTLTRLHELSSAIDTSIETHIQTHLQKTCTQE